MLNDFDNIFKMFYLDIYKLAYNYSSNKEDSEDISQRVFLKLYMNKKILYLKPNEIKKWLLRVCVNETHDFYKKMRNKIFIELDENTCKDNNELNIIYYLRNIPIIYKNALFLYYYEGYSIKEISKIIKKSESAVKMQLSRGKEILRKEMEKE